MAEILEFFTTISLLNGSNQYNSFLRAPPKFCSFQTKHSFVQVPSVCVDYTGLAHRHGPTQGLDAAEFPSNTCTLESVCSGSGKRLSCGFGNSGISAVRRGDIPLRAEGLRKRRSVYTST